MRGVSFGCGGDIRARIASKTTLNCASYLFSRACSFLARSAFVESILRSRTNARMISMLTSIARRLRRTIESIATPCSVKARGGYRRPPHELEVANCDLKLSNSTVVSLNMKSEVSLRM